MKVFRVREGPAEKAALLGERKVMQEHFLEAWYFCQGAGEGRKQWAVEVLGEWKSVKWNDTLLW